MKTMIIALSLMCSAFFVSTLKAQSDVIGGIEHIHGCKISQINTGVYKGFRCSGVEKDFVINPADTASYDLIKELVNTEATVSVAYYNQCMFDQTYAQYLTDRPRNNSTNCVKTIAVKSWKSSKE
ncbi:MAG: hypothetical protein R3A11_03480 [Bdellovibrionota bacterium]